MKINIAFHAKMYQTNEFQYTFNNRDFFKTNIRLTLMPELFIQEFYPKTAHTMTSVLVKMFVLNIHPDNKYWCLTNDG